MIEISNPIYPSQEQLQAVALAMRHAMNSEAKSDTPRMEVPQRQFGPNDYDLAKRLANAEQGNRSHCKYLRMLPVLFTIRMPMWFAAEMDTYKVGTVRESSSKMHKMMAKPFDLSDFEIDPQNRGDGVFEIVINRLNDVRDEYLNEKNPEAKKMLWRYVLELLPESYMQKSTISMNYETLHKVWIDRRNHKMSEWHDFCHWIETIPMADLIVGDKKDE